jgi:hypothetical protein
MQIHREMAFWLAAVAALTAASPVRGIVSVSDLPDLVQRADAVLRARAGGWDELPQPEGADRGLFPRKEGARATLRVQALEVRKVLAGRCPDHVLIKGTYTGADSLKEGEEAYLCLRRSPLPKPGALYEAANYGLLVLHVLEDGRVRIPKHVHYQDGQKPLLRPETTASAEAVEAALRYYRGPAMAVRALKDVVALGEPLALEVTLTNRTSGPMTLAMDRGRAVRSRFGLSLYDGRGRSVLENWRLLTREDLVAGNALEGLRGTVRLAPGDSVRRVVRFPLPPAQFVMSPGRTRTCRLTYTSGRREEAWFGWQCAECPVRLRCADRTWTDTLARPTDDLAVTLSAYATRGPARRTVGTPGGVWVTAILSRPEPLGLARSRAWSSSSFAVPKVTPAEWDALGACLEVRLGDRVLVRPDAAPDGLNTLLDRIPASEGRRIHLEHWNMAEVVDFAEPGLYRVRLVVPDGDEAARSNELLVRILRVEVGARPAREPGAPAR